MAVSVVWSTDPIYCTSVDGPPPWAYPPSAPVRTAAFPFWKLILLLEAEAGWRPGVGAAGAGSRADPTQVLYKALKDRSGFHE